MNFNQPNLSVDGLTHFVDSVSTPNIGPLISIYIRLDSKLKKARWQDNLLINSSDKKLVLSRGCSNR